MKYQGFSPTLYSTLNLISSDVFPFERSPLSRISSVYSVPEAAETVKIIVLLLKVIRSLGNSEKSESIAL